MLLSFVKYRAMEVPQAQFDALLFNRVREIGAHLEMGDRVAEDVHVAVGGPQIYVIGNSRLRPRHFNLRDADCEAIGPLALPGKSGGIDFLGLDTRGAKLSRGEKSYLTRMSFGKDADRRDHVWHTNLAALRECNYEVFFAPTSSNMLHVRLVHRAHLSQEPHIGHVPDVPRYDRARVVTIWRRA